MSLSNNSTSMPSLTSTTVSSTGSRSSGFFPKSYPKQTASYYNQNSLASVAKKASYDGRVAHSELGWADEGMPRRRQQPMYAASEPGIARHQSGFAQSDRFKSYFNRQKIPEDRERHSSEMEGDNNTDEFHADQFQQSQGQHPRRGRSSDSFRNTSVTSDDHYVSSVERSRSLSSNRFSSNLRMEPRPQFRPETIKQRDTFRSSSPLPRNKSHTLDQSPYDRSMSFAENASEENVRGRSANDQPKTESDSAGPTHTGVGKSRYYGRAEIETPTPTSVRDLKQRLWDPDETLHHWHSQNERLQKSQVEPQRLGYSASTKYSTSPESNTPTPTESRSATSSTHRSMSPKPSRGSTEPRGHSLLRNPRYSQAAARVASRSPSRGRTVSALQSASPANTNSTMETVQSELQPRNLAKTQTNSADSYGEPEAHVARGVQAESEVTTVMANKTVASLMARISAVKRSDPAEALAQIDAILNSENVSVEAVREEVGPDRDRTSSDAKESQHHDKQVTGKQPQHITRESLDEHLEEEDSSIAATSVSSMTNPTYQGSNTMRNEVLSFSNKPSLLQAYGSTALMGRKEWFRSSSEQETNPSPPSTISLSSKDKGRKLVESARQPSSHFPQIMPSNSAELADKIRRWDEMSAPDVTGVKSDDSRYPIEPPGRAPISPAGRRRAHPWDSSIPVQSDGKNASSRFAGWTKQYKPKHAARGNVATFPTDRYFDEESNSIQAFPSEYSDDEMENGPELTESKNDLTNQTQKTETMSFDSTWVSVPESSFFHQVSAPPRNVSRTDAATPSRLTNSSFDPDDTPSTPDVGFGYGSAPRQPDVSSPRPPSRLPRPDDDVHRPMQTFSPRTRQPTRDFRSLSPRAVREGRILRQTSSGDSSTDQGADVALLNKPKSRGLRSFLPKRRTLKGNVVALEENASLLSQKSDMVALDVEAPPPLESRGRRYASTQDRERSRSLDTSRSRNPNIAQKFGRLFM